MARRSTPYLLNLGSDQETEVSQSEWDELLSGGWIEPTGYKTARPKRGVVMWMWNGDLWVAPICHMPCVTADWFRIWLFQVCLVAASTVGETWVERRARIARERDRDAQNEALLWRTHRNTKGANEFRYATPQQKAEVFRALKPELLREAA